MPRFLIVNFGLFGYLLLCPLQNIGMNVLFHQHHVDVASADRDHVTHAVHQHGVDDALRAEEGIAVCQTEHECIADLEPRYFECVDVDVR